MNHKITPIKLTKALSTMFNREPVLKELVDSIAHHAARIKQIKRLAREERERREKKANRARLMSECIKRGLNTFEAEYKARNI